MNFARQVWALCEPAYREESRGGRPGIDPARSKAHGLFKGRHLGIDSSVTEANASLRTLGHPNTEQAYWECVFQRSKRDAKTRRNVVR